jgi:hypothetical protein
MKTGTVIHHNCDVTIYTLINVWPSRWVDLDYPILQIATITCGDECHSKETANIYTTTTVLLYRNNNDDKR